MESISPELDVPLADYTTIGVGGPARHFLSVETVEALKNALDLAHSKQWPVFILGGGSNLLAPDAGFAGLVIHINTKGVTLTDSEDHVLVRAMAGEDWDAFVAHMVDKKLGGVECLSGIPGKVGAAPIQNVGAYGQEVAETITEVETLDLNTLATKTFSNTQCGFSYRHSIFKGDAAHRYVVMAVTFRLKKDADPMIRYPDLQNRLGPNATLFETRAAVLAVRRSKSMVYDRHDPNSLGCGSFFTNPILSKEDYKAFLKHEPNHHPHWPQADESIKLSAAWLIDNAGFSKGYAKGRAGLSQKHCLAIINRGQATEADILALVKEIQQAVKKRFGVTLTPEPLILSQKR